MFTFSRFKIVKTSSLKLQSKICRKIDLYELVLQVNALYFLSLWSLCPVRVMRSREGK